MALTFNRGVHPASNKLSVKRFYGDKPNSPERVFIPISQHIGAPSVPIVTVGERVLRGQLIAKAAEGLSANIFSSISGTVKGFTSRPTAVGEGLHIEIENDFGEDEFRLEPLTDINKADIITRAFDAGLVGMGGAGFPTHAKMGSLKAPVESLIINASECEPYISCDYQAILRYTDKFIGGVMLISTAVGAKNVYIGIEDNKEEAISVLAKRSDTIIVTNKRERKNALSSDKIKVVVLKAKYPEGSEKQLIYAVTGKTVPTGALPIAAGAYVGNVQTAYALYRAVYEGVTLYERLVTVSGSGATEPTTACLAVGTPLSDVAEMVKASSQTRMVISGGPMMGFSLHSLDTVVTKTTNSFLFLTEKEIVTEEPSACIGCGRCVRACPMGLAPVFIDSAASNNDFAEAKRYGAANCIECGCCSYVCPAKRPIVQGVRMAKRKIRELKL